MMYYTPESINKTIQEELLECDRGKVSDGYHTFNELYEHRCLLFVALINVLYDKSPDYRCFKSYRHYDGSKYDGWIIAGFYINEEQITYHLPEKLWSMLCVCACEHAPKWDGHTSKDVLDRLEKFIKS